MTDVPLERGKDVRMFQHRGAKGDKSVGTQKRESMWLGKEEAHTYVEG